MNYLIKNSKITHKYTSTSLGNMGNIIGIQKEKKNIKKYQALILVLKNTITELKNSPEGFKNRLD